jgi:hypothetical protein
MIDIQEQWCIQIEVTNTCHHGCSNCTRFIGHDPKQFFMQPHLFSEACEALKDFPTKSSPTAQKVPNKLIGIIGGEPLLHPQFSELATIMKETIPEKKYRGLWTAVVWQKTKYAKQIEETFGYVNNNTHQTNVVHSPVLVACQDIIKDPIERRAVIDRCWLQEKWSGVITPKGLFFCEVAGAFDTLYDGPGGLPIEPDCWRRPLRDFREQIDQWCNLCGIPLNLRGRKDSECVDDISSSNLCKLKETSLRIQNSRYYLVTEDIIKNWALDTETFPSEKQPWRYMR